MIYNDKPANYDVEGCPAKRQDDICLNCGHDWGKHIGWSCPEFSTQEFSNCSPNARYLTQSMLDNIKTNGRAERLMNAYQMIETDKNESVKEDSWRAWAHNKPGDCPCGILRSACEYHRSES